MTAEPDRGRCQLARQRPDAVQREDAAVAGQQENVARLCDLGLTPAQARYGLAQGFATLEEVVGFLFAGGAADAAVQSVLMGVCTYGVIQYLHQYGSDDGRLRRPKRQPQCTDLLPCLLT